MAHSEQSINIGVSICIPGYCVRLPQTLWLKMREMYSLTLLEAKSPKSILLGPKQGISKAALSLEA